MPFFLAHPTISCARAQTEVDFRIFVDSDIPLPWAVFSRENERAAGRTVRALRTGVFEGPQGAS
ncbi:MAG: hypothetical protein WBM48_11680 [Polyangiales bacterium]